MEPKSQKSIEGDEVDFFANYYEGQAYNPTGWRLRLERELRSFKNQAGVQGVGRVLSLGCGDGQFELLLAPFAEQVIGLDISPEAISLANRKASEAGIENVEFRCQALSDLQWNETYDAVICLAFLHHVPPADLGILLGQVVRHIHPGGFLYTQDPNRRGILRKLGRQLMGPRYARYHSPDEYELDPGELAALLKQVGFKDVKIRAIDLTLIPALFLLARGPTWPLYLCAAVDWVWCHSPLAGWASGFTAVARK